MGIKKDELRIPLRELGRKIRNIRYEVGGMRLKVGKPESGLTSGFRPPTSDFVLHPWHLMHRFYQIIHPSLPERIVTLHLCGTINSHKLFSPLVMKKQRTRKRWMALQALVLVGIAGFAFLGLLSFKAVKAYTDLWEQLGTSKQSGTNSIKESFLNGYFYYTGRNIRKIVAGDRVGVAKDLLAYTKEYVSTEAFAKDYEAYRVWSKPQQPEAAKTPDVIRKKFIDDTKSGIVNMEKFLKTADASMKKSAEETLDMLKKTLKDYEDPNSEIIKMAVQGEENQYNYRFKEYQEKMKNWEEKYPAGVKAMVKARLQQLLTVTKDVDFNAQLTDRDGKKYFVNKEYERKPADWKMAFRAGKDVTGTVQAFARQWLQELQ